jgi:hypothetical protein
MIEWWRTSALDFAHRDQGLETGLLFCRETAETHLGPYFKRADPAKLSARAMRDIVQQPKIARVFAVNFEVS